MRQGLGYNKEGKGGDIIYKLVAIDIDGTLINTNMKLTVPTRQAIASAREQGIMVTLATGRSFHSAKSYADRLKLDAPLICANGALIRHRDGSVLSEVNFHHETIIPLLAEMQAAGIYIQVYHKGGIYTSTKITSLPAWIQMICDNKFKLNHLIYSVREFFLSRVRKVSDLTEGIGQGELKIHKIFSAGKPRNLEKFRHRAAELGLSVDYYPGTKDYMYLEIAPPGISKGWALHQLAGHLEIAMEEVVAIGDNLNDRTMIQAAGLGVVMGNGHSQLKKVAGQVTLSNDQDGVAAAFDHIILPAAAAPRAV